MTEDLELKKKIESKVHGQSKMEAFVEKVNPIFSVDNDVVEATNDIIEIENDAVNHPSHYTRGKIEVIDYIDAYFKDNYYLGQVCKYISRAGFKSDELEDLKKAQFYLNRYISQKGDK